MNPEFLHTSLNFLRLRRYQRAIEQHDPNTFREHDEYLLIEAFFVMTRANRERLASAFPWLNMYNTTFI
jgi:hypothetical protein